MMYSIGHIPRYSRVLLKALRSPLLIFFALAGNILLGIAAVLFYHFESLRNEQVRSFFDSVWWAFSTVSTVGYGDITPGTMEGRVVAIFLMITGVIFFVGFTAIFVSVVTSLTATDIVKSEELTYQEYKKVMIELQRIHERMMRIEKKLDTE